MSGEIQRPPPNRFARKQPWAFCGKGPGGRNLCFCGCGREVVKPRISCFSDECLAWYKSHNDPATIRGIVETRDKGVCALCGVDTIERARSVRGHRELFRWLARREAERLHDTGELPVYCGNTRIQKERQERYIELGLHSSWSDVQSWTTHWTNEEIIARFGRDVESSQCHTWEADHIIPVIEGGGGCGPEGYRTLCLGCHRQETALLAGRRAAARKRADPQLKLEASA